MEYLLYLLPCIMLQCNCMFSVHKLSASSSNLKTFHLRIPLTVDMIIKESYDRIVSNAVQTYLLNVLSHVMTFLNIYLLRTFDGF